ncbi:MAG TPA: GNAT family N-acetyltransferase [Devosia sp.]|nr:GNAT family N-acetyltransferase [Devosia sp.]
MTLTFRAARPDDLPFLIALIVEDSVVATNDDPADARHADYTRALAAIEADPNQEMIVAELDGEPVGCFQLSYLPGLMRRGMWRGQVEAVHVAAHRRNRGIGSQMMTWALARCREKGCGLVQLTSNKARVDAHRFYRRLGFEQTHEGFKYFL